jgi:S-adenosyl-L-methionine hydrolase (adenosine-forming)
MPSAAASDAAVTMPWVTFLSDYGLDDHLVGVCKGVMAGIAPQARVIDVCHQVPAQSVAIGARLLHEALPWLPVGVHLALVDPLRPGMVRPVAIRCGNGSTFVCPDNGVSSLSWSDMGGVTAARELTNSALWHPKPARSFRGRDVFAPVAAHLAAGLDLEEVGDRIEPSDLVALHPRAPFVHGDHVHGTVEMVDHFGNLQLNIARSDLEASGIALGDTVELRYGGKAMQVLFTLNFGDVAAGRTFVYEDSFRAITVLTTMGRADLTLGAKPGDPMVLSRVPQGVLPGPTEKVKVVDWPPSAGTA